MYRFSVLDLPTRLLEDTAAEAVLRTGSLFGTTFVRPGFAL